jgi:hypothetical protein
VAECERLREWLLLWMDDEARERYRRIADQYFMLARQETKVFAHARSLRRPGALRSPRSSGARGMTPSPNSDM